MSGETQHSIEDQTNLHKHASKNAQDALAMAKAKAEMFDSQAALERKTNQALKLAKAQAYFREDSETPSASGPATTSATPLVDRKCRLHDWIGQLRLSFDCS